MTELFGRRIALEIGKDTGADPATTARIRAATKALNLVFPTKEEAFARLKFPDFSFSQGRYVVWEFSSTQWGIVLASDVKKLQGPPTVPAKRWDDLRISFKVKRTSDGKPNTAELQVYNPSPDTIALVQERSIIVRLLAGYADLPWLLFSGNPIKDGINIERGGPDRVLRIEAQDGGRALAQTRLDLNFSTNTKLSTVVETVAKQAGLGVGFIKDIEDYDFPDGLVVEGSPRDILDRAAQISGADVSIQDGAVQVIKEANDTGEPAVLFSTKNGNLLKVARKEKGRVDVTALLEGTIRPGRRFVVESEAINGIFKAIDVEHTGDVFENTFTTQITARPWKKPSPATSAGIVATIKAKVIKAGQMFPTSNAAFIRANRIDYSFGNSFIARFSDTEWGIVTKAESEKLAAKGIPVYSPTFVGPVQ